jgi:hypothetical protein
MKPDTIKARLEGLFIEAEKLESAVARNKLSWAQWPTGKEREMPPESLIEEDEDLVKPFEYILHSLYLTSVCFLDTIRAHQYLKQFYLTFGEKFDVAEATSKFAFDHYWSGEHFNIFLSELRKFLAPFDLLKDSSRYLMLSGIQYLERILRSTPTIIHNSGKIPNSEAEVYKAVKAVLEVVFPGTKAAKSNFIKTAQEYKPDILIPELSAAVEYKYAEDEVRMKSVIAQISDDVKGYTGDNDYNLFYAVFYVKSDFWGIEKFNTAWSEKGFPDNWRAFYVVGK